MPVIRAKVRRWPAGGLQHGHLQDQRDSVAGWAVTATEETVRVHDRENRDAALYCFEGGGERIAWFDPFTYNFSSLPFIRP